MGVHRGASVHRGQNRLLHPLELELHHLGTELRSCSKEVCTLKLAAKMSLQLVSYLHTLHSAFIELVV